METGQIFELIQHFVFWCSIATLFLAGLERSVNKFYPGGSVAKAIGFATDLVSQYGALNLRDRINGNGNTKANTAIAGK